MSLNSSNWCGTRGDPSGCPEGQGLGRSLANTPPYGLSHQPHNSETHRKGIGWAKPVLSAVEGTIGGPRKTKLRGLQKVAAQTVFTLAAQNLTRMGGIFRWRCSTARAQLCLPSVLRWVTPCKRGI